MSYYVGMALSTIRSKKLIEALPRNNYNVTKSALEAGFSKHTARTQQKRLLRTAIKIQAKEALQGMENVQQPLDTLKKTMAELVGLSKQDVYDNIKELATQDRDYSTRLKVVRALARELGVDLGEEESSKVNVPILNVTVKERSTEPLTHDIEPQ